MYSLIINNTSNTYFCLDIGESNRIRTLSVSQKPKSYKKNCNE